MKTINKSTHEHRFAYEVDYTVCMCGHITCSSADVMWLHFDRMHMMNEDIKESIFSLLTMIDCALGDSDYKGVYVAAKRIKKILRDCGIK